MAYDNLPGVKATYEDGALRIPSRSRQPRILVLGSATSGASYELFNVANIRQGESEFGANTELFKGVHEAAGQGSDNVAVMRIGGKRGKLVISDGLGATLTITPESRDAEILEKYALLIDDSDGSNRYLIWDLVNEEWVYDSAEILVLDDGVIELVDTGVALMSVGTIGDTATYISLADILGADITTTATLTLTKTAGSDGVARSLVEKYAALNQAYHLLDYRDADYVCPMGVYVDSPNAAEAATPSFFKGVPAVGSTNDALGYVWQYIHKGRLYTYFADKKTYFSVTKAAATATVNTTLVLTAQKAGTGGNSISIQINAGGAAGPTAVVTEPTANGLHILVTDNGTGTTAAAASAINAALGAFTMSNGALASTLVSAAGGVTLLSTVASTNLSGGTGGHVLTHEQLTGEVVPSAVTTRFNAGQDAELREVNFAHQLASFCERASVSWKAIQGSISTLGPTALSRTVVSDWVGSAPVYSVGGDGSQLVILSTGDNGSGLLGLKFLNGAAGSAAGYRNSAITDAASATNGLAFGGFIKTKGLSLPNGSDYPEHSYGIDSSDEKLDVNKKPVDIGKHIHVSYDWVVHRNSFNGGTSYRGPINVVFVAKLSTMPENEEPIGPNGIVSKVTSPPKIHATQLDSLARSRMVGLRREEGLGLMFITAKTAAHPDSDYSRASTMRCVNRELQGIRRIARDYIGKEYSSQKLIALQSAIEVFLKSERDNGFNQGTKVSLSYTRADKVLGRLTIRLRMVPPFSLESIDVSMAIAADESEL